MRYHLKEIGGEMLTEDGPLDYDAACKLADEIEAEFNIEVTLVEVHDAE